MLQHSICACGSARCMSTTSTPKLIGIWPAYIAAVSLVCPATAVISGSSRTSPTISRRAPILQVHISHSHHSLSFLIHVQAFEAQLPPRPATPLAPDTVSTPPTPITPATPVMKSMPLVQPKAPTSTRFKTREDWWDMSLDELSVIRAESPTPMSTRLYLRTAVIPDSQEDSDNEIYA